MFIYITRGFVDSNCARCSYRDSTYRIMPTVSQYWILWNRYSGECFTKHTSLRKIEIYRCVVLYLTPTVVIAIFTLDLDVLWWESRKVWRFWSVWWNALLHLEFIHLEYILPGKDYKLSRNKYFEEIFSRKFNLNYLMTFFLEIRVLHV